MEASLNRHLAGAKEWFPHEYVPWSRGCDFDGVLGGRAWHPDQSSLPQAVRTSLIVNLLTEDNLPSYHRIVAEHFGRDGAWGTWVHWTAEEDRHGQAIRDYLLVSRAVDPVALERATAPGCSRRGTARVIGPDDEDVSPRCRAGWSGPRVDRARVHGGAHAGR